VVVFLEPVALQRDLLKFIGEFRDCFGVLLVLHLQESHVLLLALP
jgi:hypothetical protein